MAMLPPQHLVNLKALCMTLGTGMQKSLQLDVRLSCYQLAQRPQPSQSTDNVGTQGVSMCFPDALRLSGFTARCIEIGGFCSLKY